MDNAEREVKEAVARPAGLEAHATHGKVEISIGCCAMPQGVEARAESQATQATQS